MKITSADLKPLIPLIAKQREYQQYANRGIEKEIEKIKKQIVEEFTKHPVTIEIEGGIGASNISGTLSGITNLFSFIGFDEGTNPIDPIKSELEKIGFSKTITPAGTIIYKIYFPTAEDIFNVTPLPWATGRSWAKGIETGLSGVGYYLKKTNNSRSGLGIQSKNQVRAGVRFKNVKYISALLKKYDAEVKNINKLIL